MGRYRIRIHPDIDPDYFLPDWLHVEQYLDEVQAAHGSLILEIGSGLGDFLVAYAKSHHDWPENHGGKYWFLGLDGQKKRVAKATEKVWRQEFSHVRFFHHWLGPDFLTYWPGMECAELHIHHPDPWPKKRQRHRRIIRAEMLSVYHTLLQKQGILWLSTDHEEYARDMKQVLYQSDFFELEPPKFLMRQDLHAWNMPQTKFEKKMEDKGFPSFFLRARKAKH